MRSSAEELKRTTPEDVFRDVIPVVEGKLHDWAKWIREYINPGAPISGAYEVLQEYGIYGSPKRSKGHGFNSQPEKWVADNQDKLEIDRVVRRTLRKIAQLDRQIFWMRYVQKKTWGEMAITLHYSEQQIKQIFRERLLYVLASEFGLLADD